MLRYSFLLMIFATPFIYSMACDSMSSDNNTLHSYLLEHPELIKYQSRDRKVTQLKALPQSEQNGGDLSCGYHALKNGIEIAQAIINNQQRLEHLTNLQSADYMRDKFGTFTSSWRAFIVELRVRQRIAAIIHDHLLYKLAGEKFLVDNSASGDSVYALNLNSNNKLSFAPLEEQSGLNDVERSLLKDVLAIVASELVKDHLNIAEDKTQFAVVITVDNVIDMFYRILDVRARESVNPDQYLTINNINRISFYFPQLEDFNFTLTINDNEEVTLNEHHNTIENSVLKLYERADNDFTQMLTGDEINKLLIHEQEECGVLRGINVVVVGDNRYSNQPILDDYNSGFNGRFVGFINAISTGLYSNGDPIGNNKIVCTFIIRHGDHWYTCIVESRNKKHYYYVVNSCYNNITSSPRIKEIRQLLQDSEQNIEGMSTSTKVFLGLVGAGLLTWGGIAMYNEEDDTDSEDNNSVNDMQFEEYFNDTNNDEVQ